MKTAWVVSEASPGHDSQSNGLAQALAAIEPMRVIEVKGRVTVRGWQRPLLRAWMGRAGRPLPDHLLQRVTNLQIPPDAPPPTLVIASGGKSVFCARTLAARHRAPLVYLGEQKRFPDHWFDLIVSPVPDDPRPNVLQTEIIPTTMSPAKAQAAAAKAVRPPGRLWAMVIGGASRSHRYTDADWTALGRGMNELAKREDIRWLLTTSRRTGAHAEGLLKQTLNPEVLADAIWWSEAPRRELHAFLGMSQMAFVTQDSVTMVSEAVASGRPVVALRPGDTRLPAGSFLTAYFDRLEQIGQVKRVSIEQLRSLQATALTFWPRTRPTLPELAESVRHRLRATAFSQQT
jgi:mitochondrial fission protein ELM1